MFEAVGPIITAVIKVGVPIYIAALFASSILLFSPDPVARQIGVDWIRQSYRGYLGSAFVASISLLLAHLLTATSGAINNRLDDRRLRRLTLETLRMLTSDEKGFLRPFILEGENTLYASINDGITGGLQAKKLIYRASNIIAGFEVPYNLQPMARKLLSENRKLLD